MANRISEETIKKIPELYKELKTYAAVARQLGISATSVSRYVKLAKVQAPKAIKYKFDKELPPMEDIILPTDWSNAFTMTDEEWKELEQLQQAEASPDYIDTKNAN